MCFKNFVALIIPLDFSQQINTSRVTWVNNAVIQYYQKGEMTRVTQKELRKLTYLGLETECDTSDGCLRK